MTNNNTHRPGFKHTSVGWIPECWDMKKLNELSNTISSGKSKNKSEVGLYVVYGSTGIIGYNDTYDYEGEQILVARVGANAGTVNRVKGKYCVSDNTLILNLKNDKSYSFIYYSLINYSLDKLVFGSGQPLITGGHLKELSIPLPPLPEQQKIAEILGTWDIAIETLTKLIAAKTKRKKALMQQLLTGKKRIKGFNEKWISIHIYDVAEETSIKNTENKDLMVLSCTKYNGLVPSLEYFGRKIFSDDTSTYKIVSKNTFAYATNHIEEGSIGYQSQYPQALISPMYTVFQTNSEVNNDFLYRLLKSHMYIHEYKKRMEGSIDRRGGLRWDNFSKIKIPLPTLEEQTRIAAHLSAADNEITLLNKKLEAVKAQKKGLMQKLLTGEVRVKV